MFIRVFRPAENKEILVNTDMIWKIEITYAFGGEGGKSFFKSDVQFGLNNPDATRFYKVFVGGETIFMKGDPNDPVVKVIEDIYKNAVKGQPASGGSEPS